jgi:hypothetical protein
MLGDAFAAVLEEPVPEAATADRVTDVSLY